jgi:hypothetical protein
MFSRTGLSAAVKRVGEARLYEAWLKNRELPYRYNNRVVRSNILNKVLNGHTHIYREIDGITHIALDYGPGRCSSSFVRV